MTVLLKILIMSSARLVCNSGHQRCKQPLHCTCTPQPPEYSIHAIMTTTQSLDYNNKVVFTLGMDGIFPTWNDDLNIMRVTCHDS